MPVYALGEITPQIDPTAFVSSRRRRDRTRDDRCRVDDLARCGAARRWCRHRDRRPDVDSDGAIVHNTEVLPTRVGDDCTVGHMAHLEGCTVENAVLIGTASIRVARSGRRNRCVGRGQRGS